MDDALWTETQTAEYLTVRPSTLKKWRTSGGGPSGGGPPFVRLGRAVRYRPSDVSRWLDQQAVTTP